MAMVLPTFEDTFCLMAGVCSTLTEIPPTLRLPAENIEIISRYKSRSGTALARLVWNPGSRHFHLDVARRTAFGAHPPRTNGPIATFHKTLARFEGLTATALPHGTYSIPLSSLPTTGGLVFVGRSSIRLNTGKTEIELTGATLAFRHSNIRRLRWNLLKDSVLLEVDAASLGLTITSNYLTDTITAMDSAVATHILGKNADGK